MVKESVIDIIKKYLHVLSGVGIHARRAVLFGSFARGDENAWSDIDLVVIAPEFDGLSERILINQLWTATLKADNRIDPIPCGVKEWEENSDRPIIDIARKEGIVITV